MRSAYKTLANLIALAVVVQAAMIAFAYSGLGVWIEDGGTLDAAAMESEDLEFTGVLGFMVHGINGMMLIPLLALALLIVSFFAKVSNGIAFAGGLLALVVLQVVLGIAGHSTPYAGLLHGLNALVIFVGALQAARIAAGREPEQVAAERTDSPAYRS